LISGLAMQGKPVALSRGATQPHIIQQVILHARVPRHSSYSKKRHEV
jgi:hypothetical protein